MAYELRLLLIRDIPNVTAEALSFLGGSLIVFVGVNFP